MRWAPPSLPSMAPPTGPPWLQPRWREPWKTSASAHHPGDRGGWRGAGSGENERGRKGRRPGPSPWRKPLRLGERHSLITQHPNDQLPLICLYLQDTHDSSDPPTLEVSPRFFQSSKPLSSFLTTSLCWGPPRDSTPNPTQAQGGPEGQRGCASPCPTATCEGKENNGRREGLHHLRRAYAMPGLTLCQGSRCARAQVSSGLAFPWPPYRGKGRCLHVTVKNPRLRAERPLARSQGDWKRQGSDPFSGSTNAPCSCMGDWRLRYS